MAATLSLPTEPIRECALPSPDAAGTGIGGYPFRPVARLQSVAV